MLKGRQRKHSSLRPLMVSSLFSPVVRSDRFRRSLLSFLHLSYMLGRAVGLRRLMLSLSVFVHVCLSLCWLLAVCVCFRPPVQCFPMISICPICPWLTCLRGSCRFVPPVVTKSMRIPSGLLCQAPFNNIVPNFLSLSGRESCWYMEPGLVISREIFVDCQMTWRCWSLLCSPWFHDS